MNTEEEFRKVALRAKRSNEIIFAVFTCLFLSAVTAFCVFKYQHTFSKLKWDTNVENRYKIVNDMLGKYQLIGMSKKYFPPDSTLVYYLGVDFMDNNWLILSMDDGTVVEYCLDVS